MKKYLLLISCSLIAAQAASALTVEEQLSNMKDMFVKEFQKMDTDKDGQVSRDEYLSYQFENFRSNIITADGFDTPSKIEEKAITTINYEPEEENSQYEDDIVLGGTPSALQDMANFKLEDFYDDDDDKTISTLTRDDVMPDDLSLLTDDLVTSVTEKTSTEEKAETLETAIEATTETVTPVEETVKEQTEDTLKEEEQTTSTEILINEMVDSIRQTLPKKIDEMTTWTDIKYADNVISYVYTANIDVSEYSPGEYDELTENIHNEACVKAGANLCPKLKPMFIDRGINMKIKYLDKKSTQIGECEFNQNTCQ